MADDSQFIVSLAGLAALPSLVAEVKGMKRELAALREESRTKAQVSANADGWLDAADAAKYVGMCKNTFDFYRYKATPRLQGSPIGSKTYFKKADLDNYMILYPVKSAGLG